MSELNVDFDKKNIAILKKFLADAEKNQDDLSGSVIATMTQFLRRTRLQIIKHGRDWVSAEEIINAQVQELRICIIDLESCKLRLQEGYKNQ